MSCLLDHLYPFPIFFIFAFSIQSFDKLLFIALYWSQFLKLEVVTLSQPGQLSLWFVLVFGHVGLST